MFHTVVCQAGRVANLLLDTTGHARVNKKGEVVAAKEDSNFLEGKWATIMKAVLKTPHLKTGPGFIMLDRASVHRSKLNLVALEAAGFTIITQPPRSPDFNLLDAFVISATEHMSNELGAITVDEIKEAASKCYRTITAEMCQAALRKVKRNMAESIKLAGGNFYF